MTRYARAKGSKASNEKRPEEATPWTELKRKLSHTVDSNEHPVDSNEHPKKNVDINWKQVIKMEKRLNENLNSVWCDFKADDVTKISFLEQDNFHKKKSKSKIKDQGLNGNVLTVKEYKKLTNAHSEEEIQDNIETFKGKKDRAYSLKNKMQFEQEVGDSDSTSTKFNNKVDEDSSAPAIDKPHFNFPRFKGSKNWSLTGKEFKKIRFESQPHKRRKQDTGDQCIDINGQKVIVTRLDGFYIRKEDAIRIKKLEKDLLKKGVSKEEVRAIVKKERRISEKILARQKKKVCFNCRKGGHNLSSCPNLVENDTITLGSGICYKCGSTEHSYLDCRVSSSFKFAKCFICHEEGHISRECPDNPRGLYPNGGGCKLCGDVTHFRRDCPKNKAKENVMLGVIEDYIEAPGKESASMPHRDKKKKIIKFK